MILAMGMTEDLFRDFDGDVREKRGEKRFLVFCGEKPSATEPCINRLFILGSS
jgi:hypothetical protein